MKLRRYTENDSQILADLFFDPVHSVNAKDYSQEQLNVWATGHMDFLQWNRSLSNHYSFVAEIGGMIVGFGDIDETGYLDRLFVHYQRQGIATAICNELEKKF